MPVSIKKMQSILLHARQFFTPPKPLDGHFELEDCAKTWVAVLGPDLSDDTIGPITFHLLRTLPRFPVPADFLAQIENLPTLTTQYHEAQKQTKSQTQ